MKFLLKIFQSVSDKMRMIGAACLVGMTALTCIDVVGRYFKHPLFGSVELVSFMGILAVAMALPHTQEAKGHIGVELLVRKLSRKTRAFVDLLTGIVSFAFFGMVTWQMFHYAIKMKNSGEVSMNLELPEYVLVFVVALCFVIFSMIIIKDITETIGKMRGK